MRRRSESSQLNSRITTIDMFPLLSCPITKLSSMPACILAILLAAVLPSFAASLTDDDPTDQSVLDSSRAYYLNDLIKPHSYTPGKNSFLYQTLHKGQRKTLLDLAGSGSVRHLWSTWSIPGSDDVPPGRVLLRVFVDGQSTPAIIGTIDELCRAAERTGARYVPLPVFIYKDAYNFYIPIYFGHGIKIEIEALDEINEFYTQIDYRLTPNQANTARLASEPSASGLVLSYKDEAALTPSKAPAPEPQLQRKTTDL